MAEPASSNAGDMAQVALAHAHRLQSLLHEIEEYAATLTPEAMADFLAEQRADVAAEAFAQVRAWLDAVYAAQARRYQPAPPFTPRRLRLGTRPGTALAIGV